jgi:hypothetical protein
VRDVVVGERCLMRSDGGWYAGGTMYVQRFDRPILATPSALPYMRRRTFGIDGGVATAAVTVAGEVARSEPGGTSWIVWCMVSQTRKVRIIAGWRDYAEDFAAPFGSAFAAHGDCANERGAYLAWDLEPWPWCALAGSVDVSRTLTRTAMERGPRQDARLTLLGDIRLHKACDLAIRFRWGAVERSVWMEDQAGRSVRCAAEARSAGLRLTLVVNAADWFRSRTRIEGVRFRERPQAPVEDGLLVYQEFRWNPHQRVSFTARATFADVDSYAARIYAAEPDVEGIARTRGYGAPGISLSAVTRLRVIERLLAGAGIMWRNDTGPAGQTGSRSSTDATFVVSVSL